MSLDRLRRVLGELSLSVRIHRLPVGPRPLGPGDLGEYQGAGRHRGEDPLGDEVHPVLRALALAARGDELLLELVLVVEIHGLVEQLVTDQGSAVAAAGTPERGGVPEADALIDPGGVLLPGASQGLAPEVDLVILGLRRLLDADQAGAGQAIEDGVNVGGARRAGGGADRVTTTVCSL